MEAEIKEHRAKLAVAYKQLAETLMRERADQIKLQDVKDEVAAACQAVINAAPGMDDAMAAYACEAARFKIEKQRQNMAICNRTRLRPAWDVYKDMTKSGKKWIGPIPADPEKIAIPEVRPISTEAANRRDALVDSTLAVTNRLVDALATLDTMRAKVMQAGHEVSSARTYANECSGKLQRRQLATGK